MGCTVRFDFDYDGGGAGKGGTGRLSVNEKQVADTPVSPACQPPFRFTGSLKQVTVEAK